MTNMKNPSIYLYGAGDARLQDSPIPKITSPNDAIIQIAYVGVCGSDVHFWNDGGINGKDVSPSTPLVMGHEGSGTIHAVGSAITHLTPGDKVAIEGSYPCRLCNRCKEGLYHLCPDMKFAACPPDTSGMLTRYFKAHADMCYKLPEDISLEEGVMVEPLAVAVHAVRMVGIKPGQNVVIFGSGTIGLVCGAVARYYGAKKVVAVDIADSKLEFAKGFNDRRSTYKYALGESPQENARRIIDQNDLGAGADAVIEASGAESSVNCAVYALRPGGQYIQTGLGKPIISFPILTMSEKELHMHGACRYGPDDFRTAIDVLESKQVEVSKLISKIFDFEQTTDAWEATKRGSGIKNMIRGP